MAEQGLSSLHPDGRPRGDGPRRGAAAPAHIAAGFRQTVGADLARRPDVLVTIDSPGYNLHVLKKAAALGLARGCTTWRRRSGPGARAGCGNTRGCGTSCCACCRSSRPGSPRAGWRRVRRASGAGVAAPGQGDAGAVPRSARAGGGGARAGADAGQPALGGAAAAAGIRRRRWRCWRARRRACGRCCRCRPWSPTRCAGRRRPGRCSRSSSPSWTTSTTPTRRRASALTKSGTSTLELALAGVPMAVTYRVNPLSAAMAPAADPGAVRRDGQPAGRARGGAGAAAGRLHRPDGWPRPCCDLLGDAAPGSAAGGLPDGAAKLRPPAGFALRSCRARGAARTAWIRPDATAQAA